MVIPTPPAGLVKLIRTTTRPKAQTSHRIHQDRFRGDEFSPGPNGNARFSPISDAKGNSIPTIYGGDTFDCTAMESVFHDVPFAPGLKTLAKHEFKGHHYSQVLSKTDLVLVYLSTTALGSTQTSEVRAGCGHRMRQSYFTNEALLSVLNRQKGDGGR